jgi:hypothetical protein
VETETAMSGKYLACARTPLVRQGASYFVSSADLVRILHRLRNLPSTAVSGVVDIDSLYPSTPPKEAYDVV